MQLRVHQDVRHRTRGVVLLVTLVVLVVLAILGYRVTTRVSGQRHRLNYRIDYAKARYLCNSATKYALKRIETLEPILVERGNEPDFSAVFQMQEDEYQRVLEEWQSQLKLEMESDGEDEWFANEPNEVNDPNDLHQGYDPNDPNGSGYDDALTEMEKGQYIPGPYGAPWPWVTTPIEFEIEDAKVRIEIEDENAKYPLTWMLLEDPEIQPQIEVGFDAFCEWMGYGRYQDEVVKLKDQLGVIGQLRPYTLSLDASKQPATKTTAAKTPTPSSSTLSRARISRVRPGASSAKRTVTPAEKAQRQDHDFVRMFNSSLLDSDFLARPIIESDTRDESALKYISLWGSNKVNINTAPQHVLEAAFCFGGYTKAVALANLVIERRRVEPFVDMDDLKKAASGFTEVLDKSKPFITMTSTHFSIRVTVIQGAAQVKTLSAVVREGDKVRRIAVFSG